jgi:hypothetical protein
MENNSKYNKKGLTKGSNMGIINCDEFGDILEIWDFCYQYRAHFGLPAFSEQELYSDLVNHSLSQILNSFCVEGLSGCETLSKHLHCLFKILYTSMAK